MFRSLELQGLVLLMPSRTNTRKSRASNISIMLFLVKNISLLTLFIKRYNAGVDKPDPS